MTGQSSPSPDAGTTGWHRHGEVVWRDGYCPTFHLPLDARIPVLVLPLDGLREQIARTIDRADNKWQHGIGASGYDPNGPPLWLADAVLALLAGFAAGQGTT